MKRKVMNLQEGKLLKTWLKRKVRVTEALIVAFFIAGNLGWAQESSNNNSSNGDSNTIEDGIAIGRLIEVTLQDGAIISVFPKVNENGKYSFAEKGTAKAELAKIFDAGFRITNYKNKWNKDYETMIGAEHKNGSGEDRYANMKEESCKDNCEENKLAKSIAIGGDSVARNASIAIGDYAFASRKRSDKDKKEDKENVQGAAIAIGSFATATASSAISLGAAASAQDSNSIAIGRQSAAVKETSIAIGKVAAAAGKGSIAIGSSTEAEGENSVVIGKESKTKKLSDMNNNESNGKEKMKISEEVKTRLMKNPENEALSGSNNSLEATVILGASSIATGKHGVTLGHDVRNYGNDGVSIGNQSLVSGHGGVAIGKWAGAYQDKSLALGYDVEAHSINGMAFGVEAIQRGDQGIAIGYQAKSKGNDSIAIGSNAKVGNGTIADMKVSRDQHTHTDTVNGEEKEVEKAVAIGNNAKVEVSNSVALGANSEAKKYETVGKVEITPLSLKDMKSVNSNGSKIEIPTEKFAGMKKNGNGSSSTNGNETLGVVSIGKKGEERQLQHVAAGRISQDSTDAINGSQLFAVANYLASGWKIANGRGYVGDVSLGKQVSFVGEEGVKVSVEKENGKGYKVKISTPGAVTKKDLKDLEKKGLIFMGNDGKSIHRSLGKILRIKGEGITREESEKFRSAKGNINVRQNGKSILEIQLAKELKHIESISNGGDIRGTKITLENGRKEVNVNHAKITNVADGKADTDAVNVSQLNKEIAASKAEIKEGNNISITEKIGANGHPIYEVGLKDKVTLGKDSTKQIVVDGETGKLTVGNKVSLDGTTGNADFGKVKVNGEAGTVGGLTNKEWDPKKYVTGQAATEDQLKVVDDKIEKVVGNINETINKGLNFGADKGENVHRNLGDTQKIVGDKKNIMTSVEENGDIQVALNSEISVEKVSIPKKEGGEAVTISSENGVGNIHLAGKPGENGKETGAKISVEEGSAGVEAKDPKEKMERIVYQDSKGNSHTVATHDDGLKFQGDDGKTIHKKLNETLRITGGEKDSKKLSQGNIGVISMEDGGLTIQLAKELKDLSKITLVDGNGKKAVIDGGSLVFEGEDGKKTQLTSKGLDNGGNRITNVAAGEAPTDAVNVSQLNEVKGAVQQNAQRIDKMNGEMRRGLASAAAMSGLEFMEIGINQGTVAAAVGGWKGTQAVAVGIQGAPTENVRINGKVSVAPGYKQVDTMYSVGASYRFNWK
ncbi:YadA-like family protein [Fusobacterium necrophorum]|uniref:YadA-like family protein n=1 Tax=Fusobacterium necrophorum TaxID=859 RepID=UPI0025507CAB|nr:YadA-like family protein [Fusobacterium necrophorum]MDK4521825.1 YadA-like family protein [Fusobacterium necrophorum]